MKKKYSIKQIKRNLQKQRIKNARKKRAVASDKLIATYLLEATESNNWFITEAGKNSPTSPMERKVAKILKSLKYEFFKEVSFKDLNPTNTSQGYLRFDFYLPAERIAIEYDGKAYHNSEEQKFRDKLKDEYCKKNNINLIRLTKDNIKDFEKHLIIFQATA